MAAQEGNGPPKQLSPPRGEQEPVGMPGDATAGTTATHPEDTALVSVRPAPRRRCLGCWGSDTFCLQGARHSFPFVGTHCQSQPIPVPGIPAACPSQDTAPTSLHQQPQPTVATQLYTQCRNKLLLSHPAWLQSVPKLAWAHVAHGHLLLLLHGHHPCPQGSALLHARMMLSPSRWTSPVLCQGDHVLVPKSQLCSAPFLSQK